MIKDCMKPDERLHKHFCSIPGALNFFTSSVNTLCHKTMEDTLGTIKQYENARYTNFHI